MAARPNRAERIMGNKTSQTGPKPSPKRNDLHDELDTFDGAENNSDSSANWDSVALTPLGERFFKAQAELSSSRQKLLRLIIDESNETFFLSSRELGRRYNVDSATIIRTVQALGYEKFADFAHDLRKHFVTQITPYTAMKAAEQTHLSVADRVRQSLDQDQVEIIARLHRQRGVHWLDA